MANLLIVGLGNVGLRYQLNRHNVGFIALNSIASYFNITFNEKFKGEFAKKNIDGIDCYFLKPSTFMNKSGESVIACANFFKIELEDIVVLHDDIDLVFGDIRYKKSSGSGGQNGIKSIINSFGSNNFHRIKFGVGRPENSNIPVSDFVLSDFSKTELIDLDIKMHLFIKNINLLINKNFTDFIKTLTIK